MSLPRDVVQASFRLRPLEGGNALLCVPSPVLFTKRRGLLASNTSKRPPREGPRRRWARLSQTDRLIALGIDVPIRFVASAKLPTRWVTFDIHGFEDRKNEKEHVVLSLGDVASGQPILARVHSECLTGDALFSRRCDCGTQLEVAQQAIAEKGRGAVLYLRQKGRGIGPGMIKLESK